MMSEHRYEYEESRNLHMYFDEDSVAYFTVDIEWRQGASQVRRLNNSLAFLCERLEYMQSLPSKEKERNPWTQKEKDLESEVSVTKSLKELSLEETFVDSMTLQCLLKLLLLCGNTLEFLDLHMISYQQYYPEKSDFPLLLVIIDHCAQLPHLKSLALRLEGFPPHAYLYLFQKINICESSERAVESKQSETIHERYFPSLRGFTFQIDEFVTQQVALQLCHFLHHYQNQIESLTLTSTLSVLSHRRHDFNTSCTSVYSWLQLLGFNTRHVIGYLRDHISFPKIEHLSLVFPLTEFDDILFAYVTSLLHKYQNSLDSIFLRCRTMREVHLYRFFRVLVCHCRTLLRHLYRLSLRIAEDDQIYGPSGILALQGVNAWGRDEYRESSRSQHIGKESLKVIVEEFLPLTPCLSDLSLATYRDVDVRALQQFVVSLTQDIFHRNLCTALDSLELGSFKFSWQKGQIFNALIPLFYCENVFLKRFEVHGVLQHKGLLSHLMYSQKWFSRYYKKVCQALRETEMNEERFPTEICDIIADYLFHDAQTRIVIPFGYMSDSALFTEIQEFWKNHKHIDYQCHRKLCLGWWRVLDPLPNVSCAADIWAP